MQNQLHHFCSIKPLSSLIKTLPDLGWYDSEGGTCKQKMSNKSYLNTQVTKTSELCSHCRSLKPRNIYSVLDSLICSVFRYHIISTLVVPGVFDIIKFKFKLLRVIS